MNAPIRFHPVCSNEQHFSEIQKDVATFLNKADDTNLDDLTPAIAKANTCIDMYKKTRLPLKMRKQYYNMVDKLLRVAHEIYHNNKNLHDLEGTNYNLRSLVDIQNRYFNRFFYGY